MGGAECNAVDEAAAADRQWSCSALAHRLPLQCEEPDDELKALVGDMYAKVLDHLGIKTRLALAGSDASFLVQEAGGPEFLSLVLDWIARAQSTEIADKMVEIFDDNQALLGHLRACGVSNPGDLLDQTAGTMQRLLRERCGVSQSLAVVGKWREACQKALEEHSWMRNWVHRSVAGGSGGGGGESK